MADDDEGIPEPPTAPSPIGAVTGERRNSLLEAILENPDSIEARQVYADQLMANNDPRGEFISVELALDGPLSIRKRDQLKARRKALIEANAPTWWPFTAGHWRTKRGFLTSTSGTPEQLVKVGGALFAAEPITDVEVSGAESFEELEDLVKAPWFPRVRRLVLRGELGDEGFAELCASKKTANLRSLNVTANGISGDGFENIANAFPRLETFVLTANEIGDDGAANLRQWRRLDGIETLYLSGCGLGSGGVETLFGGAPMPKLVRLTLSNNDIGDAGATVLATNAARLPALEHLEILNNGISTSAATALAKAYPKLRRLDVRRNRVSSMLGADDPRVRVD